MAQAGSGDSVYFIGNEVQQRVLTVEAAMDAIEGTYREWDAGQATIGPKTNLYIYNDDDTRYGFSIIHAGQAERHRRHAHQVRFPSEHLRPPTDAARAHRRLRRRGREVPGA